MSETYKQGSIFQEMIERRSRSEELNALAVSQGLPAVASWSAPQGVVEDESQRADPEVDLEDSASTETKNEEIDANDSSSIFEDLESVPVVLDAELPALEIEEASAPGYFDSIGLDDGDLGQESSVAASVFEDDGPSLGEVEAESESVGADESLSVFDSVEEISLQPGFEEIVVSEGSALASVGEFSEPADDFEPFVDPVSDLGDIAEPISTAAPEPEGIEPEAPVSIEDEIDESDAFLPPEPEGVFDAEVMMAAEELVNRIGPVVDIQSLPKTQPMRVLSKAAKAAEEEANPAPAAPVEVRKETPRVAEIDSPPTKAVVDKEKPKLKKKKVSLLDSYFKGL